MKQRMASFNNTRKEPGRARPGMLPGSPIMSYLIALPLRLGPEGEVKMKRGCGGKRKGNEEKQLV